MISIGPEGGRARVDTSFSPNPFTRMRPANPNTNPGGKIFGENGTTKIRTAETVFGPKLGEIRFNRPSPKVDFTPEAAAKADAGTTFAKARARNQAQVQTRQTEKRQIAEAISLSALPNTLGEKSANQLIRQSTNSLNRSVDFKGFQTIPQVKEPAQEGPAKDAFRGPEAKKFISIVEAPKFSQVLRDWRTLSKDAISTNRLVRIREVSENRKSKTEDGFQITRRTVATQPQPVFWPVFEPLPVITREKVASFTALRPLVDQGVLTEDQAMQRAGVIGTPRVEDLQPISKPVTTTFPKVEGVTADQAEKLASMRVIIREGNPSLREQIFSTVGVEPKIGQKFVKILSNSDSKVNYAPEASPIPQEQPVVKQAMTLVKKLDIDFQTEDETQLKKKAQALIAVISQTYQLSALGKTESDTALLVERQLTATEAVPQRIRARVSSLLVSMIREVTTNPTEDPAKKALHQVDLEKQNKRVKLATKSIDQAPRNGQGEIARDYVIGQIQENNNQNYWGKLAIILRQNFDGSLDEMVVRLKKFKFWENAQTMAKTIDDSMAEYPAVEPAFKQTTKEVGRKEVGKTMDPMWAEMIKSLIKTLIVTPQATMTRA